MITYVASYDGWGQARVSCISGCSCAATTLDAKITGDTNASLNQEAAVNVTQHERCQVEALVLDSSSSGGHRFKLVSVIARVIDLLH